MQPMMLGSPSYTTQYKAVVLSLLLVTYTFNFIDRTIIRVIGQAIKVDLELTDTQLGLLGGFSFAVLYTFFGVPIARLAERRNRVSIISASLVIWSGFTIACGFAQSFWQLVLMRVGVGVGEAGCSPPAHSLISDYFEPKKRASALSIYSFGIPLGTMIGAISGGWLTDTFDWRTALLVVGLPGIFLAIIVKLMVKEPPRGYSEDGPATAPPAFTADAEWAELRTIAIKLFAQRGTLNVVIGMTLASVAINGSAIFSAPYFIRAFDLSYTKVGVITGVVGGLSAGFGTLVGGFAADRAARGGVRWYTLVPAFGLFFAGPLYILAYCQQSWEATALILLAPGVFAFTCLGPTYSIVQNSVEPSQRATATALVFFVTTFIGVGCGSLLTGWLIDMFTQLNFARLGAADGWIEFARLCADSPDVRLASSDLANRCSTALAEGTRLGLIVTLSFHIWAGIHYFLASRNIEDQLGHLNEAHPRPVGLAH